MLYEILENLFRSNKIYLIIEANAGMVNFKEINYSYNTVARCPL